MMLKSRPGGYTKREFRRITRWLYGLFPQDGWVAAKDMAWMQMPDFHFNTRSRRSRWLAIQKSIKPILKGTNK